MLIRSAASCLNCWKHTVNIMPFFFPKWGNRGLCHHLSLLEPSSFQDNFQHLSLLELGSFQKSFHHFCCWSQRPFRTFSSLCSPGAGAFSEEFSSPFTAGATFLSGQFSSPFAARARVLSEEFSSLLLLEPASFQNSFYHLSLLETAIFQNRLIHLYLSGTIVISEEYSSPVLFAGTRNLARKVSFISQCSETNFFFKAISFIFHCLESSSVGQF